MQAERLTCFDFASNIDFRSGIIADDHRRKPWLNAARSQLNRPRSDLLFDSIRDHRAIEYLRRHHSPPGRLKRIWGSVEKSRPILLNKIGAGSKTILDISRQP